MGGEVEIINAEDLTINGKCYVVHCDNCKSETCFWRNCLSEEQTTTKWNRRVIMPTEPTPREAIIKLNRIRTGKGERPPEIDMAIRAINRCMVKRKPDLNIHDDPLCPNCRAFVKMFTGEFCPKCGQALDWSEPKCKT